MTIRNDMQLTRNKSRMKALGALICALLASGCSNRKMAVNKLGLNERFDHGSIHSFLITYFPPLSTALPAWLKQK
jgi:hypothetical protein